MVFPKNIFKSIIKNTFSNENKPKTPSQQYKHYDQGKSPFTKPQSWNLSIPKLKEDQDDQSISTIATSQSSVSDLSTPPKRRRSSIEKTYTVHNDKHCPLPIVKVSNPASPSAPWMPTSPPSNLNESKYWNLTIPSPASALSKKRSSLGDNKQGKKQKINHRSRVMAMDGKSVVVDSCMDAPRVLPRLPVISIDEDFPPTSKRKLNHPPVLSKRSDSPIFYNEKESTSHSLISQQKYDELLSNALENGASLTIIKYLSQTYIQHQCDKLSLNTFHDLLQRCVRDEEYLLIIQSIFDYYKTKNVDLSTEFQSFVTTSKCTTESQESSMISLLKLFLKHNPKLFYHQDTQQNNILHLILKHQSIYPCTKLLNYILDLNSNNKKRYTTKNKNLLWCRNKLKQYPLHIAMIHRHSIPLESLEHIIQFSAANTKNANFLFDKDCTGCTPIHYLWMTRVDNQFHLKSYEKINHTYYKSLYAQSLQQLYHQNSPGQQVVRTLVDLLFGSTYVQILKSLLGSFDSFLHGVMQLKEVHLEEIKLLLLLYPHQLLQKDSKGKTPLHYAASKSADVLQIILQGDDPNIQASVRTPDKSNKLPLHYFIESSAIKRNTTPRLKIEIVRKLLEIYPDGIEWGCNGFYPFMMAAEKGGRDDDLDVIYTLLRMSPNLVLK